MGDIDGDGEGLKYKNEEGERCNKLGFQRSL